MLRWCTVHAQPIPCAYRRNHGTGAPTATSAVWTRPLPPPLHRGFPSPYAYDELCFAASNYNSPLYALHAAPMGAPPPLPHQTNFLSFPFSGSAMRAAIGGATPPTPPASPTKLAWRQWQPDHPRPRRYGGLSLHLFFLSPSLLCCCVVLGRVWTVFLCCPHPRCSSAALCCSGLSRCDVGPRDPCAPTRLPCDCSAHVFRCPGGRLEVHKLIWVFTAAGVARARYDVTFARMPVFAGGSGRGQDVGAR